MRLRRTEGLGLVQGSACDEGRPVARLLSDGLLSPIGGRKFVVCLLVIGLASWLCARGNLAGGYWVTAVTFAAGFYKASNIMAEREAKK